eukprot:g28762.t1
MGNACNFAHSTDVQERPDLVSTELCYQFMSKGQDEGEAEAKKSNRGTLVQLSASPRGFLGTHQPSKKCEGPPLMLAAQCGHVDVMEELLRNGAKVGARTQLREDTALHFAASSRKVEACQMLIRHAADIDVRNRKGQKPLQVAMSLSLMRRNELIQLLTSGLPAGDEGSFAASNTSVSGKKRATYYSVKAKPVAGLQLKSLFPNLEEDDTPSPRLLPSHTFSELFRYVASHETLKGLFMDVVSDLNGEHTREVTRRGGSGGSGSAGSASSAGTAAVPAPPAPTEAAAPPKAAPRFLIFGANSAGIASGNLQKSILAAFPEHFAQLQRIMRSRDPDQANGEVYISGEGDLWPRCPVAARSDAALLSRLALTLLGASQSAEWIGQSFGQLSTLQQGIFWQQTRARSHLLLCSFEDVQIALKDGTLKATKQATAAAKPWSFRRRRENTAR